MKQSKADHFSFDRIFVRLHLCICFFLSERFLGDGKIYECAFINPQKAWFLWLESTLSASNLSSSFFLSTKNQCINLSDWPIFVICQNFCFLGLWTKWIFAPTTLFMELFYPQVSVPITLPINAIFPHFCCLYFCLCRTVFSRSHFSSGQFLTLTLQCTSLNPDSSTMQSSIYFVIFTVGGKRISHRRHNCSQWMVGCQWTRLSYAMLVVLGKFYCSSLLFIQRMQGTCWKHFASTILLTRNSPPV